MKKLILATVVFIAATFCGAGDIITIGSGPMGGAYYPAGVGLGDIITKHNPDIKIRVEVTAGALENVSLLAQEEAEIGITSTDYAYFSSNGMPPFPGKVENIAALFGGLAPGAFQYVVWDDSDINSILDLPGKKVAVGPQGNAASFNFKELLAFYGEDYADVKANYLPISDGVEQLLDGHVDMAIVQAGIPSPAIQEALASGKKLRILSFPQEDREKILERFPYFSTIDLDKSIYPALGDAVITTFTTNNLLIVRTDLPEDLVYRITASVFDNLDDFHKIHPVARWVNPQSAVKTPIPLHPGSAKYFKEKGYLK